jgi:serine/threonine protein kinase
MIEEYFIDHEKNEKIESKNHLSPQKLYRKSATGSPFYLQGEFLKEIIPDSYFKFQNFEKCKIGKKTHIIGAGAFGDVYLAKHKKDGKFYAIKQMDKSRILETGAKLDIIKREIDIHSRLRHDNIVKLLAHHEDEKSFYLVLEYINAGTLFTAIKKNKGFTEKDAFKYFIQTASAVAFLHENNLIHRDLKPENLLLDDKGHLKLCDFGWCVELEIGSRQTFCGTYEYMAPEIIQELPYDKCIDVWSLGILLYELTHGYSPFRAQHPGDEEYAEIFRNIIKYNFTIDKDVSENCKILIQSKNKFKIIKM